MRKSGILLLLSFAVVGSLSAIVASGRLQSPMASSSKAPVAPGLQRLEDATRGGLLYVPKSYRPTEPLPLLILLHGREGDSWNWFGSYGKRAEGGRFIIVAPDSL